jgi:hypothetical protein
LNKTGSDSYDNFAKSIPRLKKALRSLVKKIRTLKAYKIISGQKPKSTICNFSLIIEINERIKLEFLFLGTDNPKLLNDSFKILYKFLDKKDLKLRLEDLVNHVNKKNKSKVIIRYKFSELYRQWEPYDPLDEKSRQLSILQESQNKKAK